MGQIEPLKVISRSIFRFSAIQATNMVIIMRPPLNVAERHCFAEQH